jgi:[acyl-carrier-protein] S-malonyltransferase
MKEALARVEMMPPAVPLVANVLAGPVTDPGRIAELLVAQVTGQVRWRETVDWLAANGVDAFCELGAGKVLTGLARRIAPDAAAIAVNTPQDIADLLAR